MKEQDIVGLIGLLENEKNVLSNLLGLEVQKNEILVSQDLNLLASLTERENLLSENLSSLEEERLAFCSQHDIDDNLAGLTAQLPENLRNRLQAGRDALVDTLKKIKLYNEINSRILQEAIKFFRYSVSLLAGEEAGSRTYSPDGTDPGDGRTNRGALVLDRKI
jgi:flagellar biosynthesis/type III secretory pathway chaperone